MPNFRYDSTHSTYFACSLLFIVTIQSFYLFPTMKDFVNNQYCGLFIFEIFLISFFKLDYKVTWQKIKDVFRRAGR